MAPTAVRRVEAVRIMTNIDPPSWHEGAYWPPKATRDAKERAVRHAAGLEGQDATREPRDATEAAQGRVEWHQAGCPAIQGYAATCTCAPSTGAYPNDPGHSIPDEYRVHRSAASNCEICGERHGHGCPSLDRQLEGHVAEDHDDVPSPTAERLARYADVILDYWFDPAGGKSERPAGDHVDAIARAVIAVADQEQADLDAAWKEFHDMAVAGYEDDLAELRAEVERQAVLLRAINDCHLDPARAILQADRLAGEAIIRAHIAEARVAEMEATVARVREQLQHECHHSEMSWTGVDQAWGDDKVWSCDNCGQTGTSDALGPRPEVEQP